MSILLLFAGLCGAITAKIAARKGRFVPLWCVYGALLFPLAIPHAILATPYERCPRCGVRVKKIRYRHPCSNCAYEPPEGVSDAILQREIKNTVHTRMGASMRSAIKNLEKQNRPYRLSGESTAERTVILCDAVQIYGYDADISIEACCNKISKVHIRYQSDTGYGIYYELRAALVPRFGKPCPGDTWSAKAYRLTLATESKDEQSAQTTLTYEKNSL